MQYFECIVPAFKCDSAFIPEALEVIAMRLQLCFSVVAVMCSLHVATVRCEQLACEGWCYTCQAVHTLPGHCHKCMPPASGMDRVCNRQ